MLPTPETTVWSSSTRLISDFLARIAATAASGSKRGSSGSRAMWATGSGTSEPSTSTSGASAQPPKVRWSTNRSSLPSSRVARMWACLSTGASAGCTSICPLIPRCTTRAASSAGPAVRESGVPASGSSKVSHRYLPRRHASRTRRPLMPAIRSAAPSTCLRTERGRVTVTASMTRPATCSARPRRTTSTSGSSGTSGFGGQRPVGGARGLLLGFLLGASDTGTVGLAADHGGGGEFLVVVRARRGDLVGGHAETALGGQLLQARLPVEPGAHSGAALEQLGEQPQYHATRHLDAVLQMHGTEQRLHAVGEDARLVPAAGELFALAEQQVRAEAARAETSRHFRERVHVHHARAQLRQLALGLVRVLVVEPLGDAQAQHRVAEELQALVGGQAAVLVGVRPVCQRQAQQIRSYVDA